MNIFEDTSASIWEHVNELRQVFIQCLSIISLGVFVCFWFHPKIVDLIALTLKPSSFMEKYEVRKERVLNKGSKTLEYIDSSEGSLPRIYKIPPGEYIEIEHTKKTEPLVLLGPLEGMIPILKLSFWMGLVLTAPFWLYPIFRFIKPGLNSTEQQIIIPFFVLSFLFMILGGCLSYFFIIPIANSYLFAFNSNLGMNLWSLSNYLNFTLFLVLAGALSFELGAIFFIAVHYNLISFETMKEKRRYVILFAFIAGAILTPPDILTQFALALPLIGLYEIALLYAKIRNSYFTRTCK